MSACGFAEQVPQGFSTGGRMGTMGPSRHAETKSMKPHGSMWGYGYGTALNWLWNGVELAGSFTGLLVGSVANAHDLFRLIVLIECPSFARAAPEMQ